GTEVANDRVRFPQHEAVVDDRGHQPVWIQRPVFGLVVAAERPADVFALVSDIELGAAPQNFLHIAGRLPSQNLQHARSPLVFTSQAAPGRESVFHPGTPAYFPPNAGSTPHRLRAHCSPNAASTRCSATSRADGPRAAARSRR